MNQGAVRATYLSSIVKLCVSFVEKRLDKVGPVWRGFGDRVLNWSCDKFKNVYLVEKTVLSNKV